MSDLIEYAYIFLNTGSENVPISESCDGVYLVVFSCQLLTLDILQNLLDCCWLFSANYYDPKISAVSI